MNPSDLVEDVRRCLLQVVFELPDGRRFVQRLPCVPPANDPVIINGRSFIALAATWHFNEDDFGGTAVQVHVPLRRRPARMPVYGEPGDL